MREWIAQRVGVELKTIGINTPFADMGLDSVTAVELTHQLEKAHGVDVAPTATWDFPNILALADHATATLNEDATPAEPLDALSERELAALLAGELKTQ
jgi:acyl carrier protein